VFGRRTADSGLLKLRSIALAGALVATPVALTLMVPAPRADATPNFARQTGRRCSFCHRGVPRLNDMGVAFKNNGFRFPESDEPADKGH
jgi:hypothetical protein